MRTVDIIRLVGPFIGLIVAIVLAPRRQIFRRLVAAGATSPEAAQPIAGTGMSGFWRRRLLAAGVLRPVDGDRYWLHYETWRAYQTRRKRRALTIVAIVGTLALATVAYVAWRARSSAAAPAKPSPPLARDRAEPPVVPFPETTKPEEVAQNARAVLAWIRPADALGIPQPEAGYRVGRILRVRSEDFPSGYLVVELTGDQSLPIACLAMTPDGQFIMLEDRRQATVASLDLKVAAEKVGGRLGHAPISTEYVYFHNQMERGISLCRPLVEARSGEGTLYLTSRSEVFADESSPVARRVAAGTPVLYEMSNGERLVPLGRW